MNEKREEMKNALKNIDFPFNDQDQITSFLQQDQKDKDNIFRVFAWLIQFGVLSNEKDEAINIILDMYEQYNEDINYYFNDSINPLQNIQDEETSLILLDVRRINDWFIKMATPFKYDKTYLDDFQFHIRRILFFLPKIKEDPFLKNVSIFNLLKKMGNQSEYHYIQGFDRYASITYILSLDFIKKINDSYKSTLFPLEFAEMLSLYFTYLFIGLSRLFINITNSTQQTMEVFEKIDEQIELEIPSISKKLKNCSTSSIHFALRWALLLFADEHNFDNCLILWDHFVLHQTDFAYYIIQISISHLKQVPYDGISYIDKIQNFKNWDLSTIISEAESKTDDLLPIYNFVIRASIRSISKLIFEML